MSFLMIVLLVAVRIFSNSFAGVFQKKLVKSYSNALLINAAVYIILSVVLLPRIFFLDFQILSAAFWFWACLDGIFGAAGNAFMIKALENGELSVLGPINAWKPVIGMIGGIFLLSELPSLIGIGGLVLIVIGSYWILGADTEGFHWQTLVRRDILYRVGAMILTALEAVFIKKVILLSSVELAFLSWCWFGALFSLIGGVVVSTRGGSGIVLFSQRRNFLLLLMLALCFGSMEFSTNLVFDRLPVGLSLALFQLSAMVNLYLGWTLFKEKGMRQKIFGTILTVIGAALIILFR